MTRLGLPLAAALLVGAAAAAYGAGRLGARDAGPSTERFDGKVELPVDLRYLQWLPDGYADPARAKESWPLLLFLHGAGECGDDLDRVKRHGPPKRLEEGFAIPAIVVAPQSRKLGWEPLAVLALLDHLQATLRVDADRVWLTGLSMGGHGTWMTATRAPERFAAIVPICGWGDYLFVRGLRATPVWAFHGKLDPIVPVACTEALVESLRAAGGDPKFTEYAFLAHDSWTRAYEDPALWEWLLQQKRAPK